MENKLDILTKKLYEEGVEKARREAEELMEKARQEAERILDEARAEAGRITTGAKTERENLKKKADSEMALSARQAIAALKQSITELVTNKVAGDIAQAGFEDKTFIRDLLMTIVQKWDVSSGSLNLDLVVPAEEKKQFEALVASKYKNLLDNGLEVKAGSQKDAFVIRPKDGSYQITFSEALFEEFFSQYMRGFTKNLLFE